MQITRRASARGDAEERGAGDGVAGARRSVAAGGAQQECKGCNTSGINGSSGTGTTGSGGTSVLTTAGAVEELLAVLPHDMRQVPVFLRACLIACMHACIRTLAYAIAY